MTPMMIVTITSFVLHPRLPAIENPYNNEPKPIVDVITPNKSNLGLLFL